MARPDIAGYFRSRSRLGRWELVFWAGWFAAFLVPGSDLVLLSQILVWGLFALALDLLLGYRGIPSLGHAAFFGIGAYTAGFLGKYGWTEPISGLVAAGVVAGVAGLATGRIVRNLHGIGLLMVTLGLNMILFDFVHRSTGITGGDDGLQGIEIAPVLGVLRFDMAGRTAYLYTLVVALLCVLGVRALIRSSYGLSLLGARENPRRMMMLGAPIERDVTMVFGLSAMLAGIAGGLLAQTSQFVSPEAMAFTRSADVLVMLVIGGTAVLYGGFVGATVFILLRDLLSAFNPIYWYFWIGLLLVLIVATFRKGVLPALVHRLAQWRGGRA
jgi:branched-chain amino acid transport system permease protein